MIEIDTVLILLKIGCVLSVIGMICLGLVIPSFYLSKELKAHPGSLILGLSYSELIMYYGVFWMYMYVLNIKDEGGYDIFKWVSHTMGYLSYDFILIPPENLFSLTSTFVATCLEISVTYYAVISLDVIFLFRNPFYIPNRRIKILHFFSIIIPLTIFLPLRIYALGSSAKMTQILPGIEVPLKDQWAQYLDITIDLIVIIIIIFSMIFSYIRMKKLNTPKHQKTIFLFKITFYTIIGLCYCSFSILQDVSMISIALTDNPILWLTLYISCSLAISVCGIVVLPIRMAEPGVWSQISIQITKLFKRQYDPKRENQIRAASQISLSYYSFIHTSLNRELASNILKGITMITRENKCSNTKDYQSSSDDSKLIKNYSLILQKEGELPRSALNRSSSLIISMKYPLIQNQKKNKIMLLGSLLSNKQSVRITEYQPDILKRIRKRFKIKKRDILRSLDPSLNESNIFKVNKTEGKSESFFIYTYDKKFVIKTSSPNEIKVLLKLLPLYERRIGSLTRSFLSKIYGIYKVKMKGFVGVHIILMENLLPSIPEYNLQYVFDLKGCFVHRFVTDHSTPTQTLKDINFLKLRLHKQVIKLL